MAQAMMAHGGLTTGERILCTGRSMRFMVTTQETVTCAACVAAIAKGA